MTPTSKSKPTTNDNKKKSGAKASKKENTQKANKKSEPKDATTPELVMKKKEATAKSIDKTQAKRLVKPVRTRAAPGKKPRKIVKAVAKKARNIGIEVIPPTDSCNDPLCPFHGTLPVRGQIINGIVMSSKMDKTAIIQREVKMYISKYERFEKRTHKYAVHNPPCLNVQRGDLVKIMECRPLSKSKSFVVIEKL